MIKFFSHIRKSLLMENKTGKATLPAGRYLKYAIGEIVLVVIGILIALQINNWNETRKSEAIEQDYYCQLLNDLELDKIQIETLTKEAKNHILIGKQLIKNLHTLKKEKNELMEDCIKVLRSNAYITTNVTYIDLKSSGNLGLLKNKVLKKTLIQYQSDIENIARIIEGNRAFRVDELMTGWDNVLELGWQEQSISGDLELDEELLKLLPNNQWHLDPKSNYFQKFQEAIFVGITIAQREIQLLKTISKKMKPLYTVLNNNCNK